MIDDQRWRSLFNDYSNSSFLEVLRRESPHLIPGHEPPRVADVPEPPHGTTVISVRYRDGVIMAGDRQATAGYQVASRRIEKIFKADVEPVMLREASIEDLLNSIYDPWNPSL
jgi:hypothetical protein